MRGTNKSHKRVIDTDVLIIGGGVGGCGVGLEYIKSIKASTPDSIPIHQPAKFSSTKQNTLDQKHPVMIVDANELLSGTSSITPGRAGLGFHYKHLPTAKMYLNATLSIALDYQTKMVGGDVPPSHYLKRGRYFVTKDSQETPKNLLNLYEELRKEYKRFADQRPEILQVFGQPGDFFRVLDPSEYKDEVNVNKVALGIETAEQLLDWPEFKATVRKQVYESGIKVEEKCKVTGLEYGADCFLVTTNKDFVIKAALIINATWQNIELLNQQVDFIMPKDHRTNRLKALAQVTLPDALKEKNSQFFCMGPHCMISNMGDGTALMSYAPETNLESSTEIEVSELAQRYLSGKMSIPEKWELGNNIIQGVAGYIPAMKEAKLLDVRTGIVKTLGKVDIFSHDSQVHERDYSGIEVQQIGFISNACMKLLYIFENGRIVSNLIHRHFRLNEDISKVIDANLADRDYNDLQKQVLKPLFLMRIKQYSQCFGIKKMEDVETQLTDFFKISDRKVHAHEELIQQSLAL